MIVDVVEIIVEIIQHVHTTMDVGCCCAYNIHVQQTNFEEGEDSREGEGGKIPTLALSKCRKKHYYLCC